MKNLNIIGARLLIKEQKAEEKTKGGIILQPQDREKTYTGTVLKVGKGSYLESGLLKPMEIEVGDTVIYAKFAGTPIKVEDEHYLILNERDVLAYIRDEIVPTPIKLKEDQISYENIKEERISYEDTQPIEPLGTAVVDPYDINCLQMEYEQKTTTSTID